MHRRLAGIALAAAVLAVPAMAQEGYPIKPVRILVPLSAGSATDLLARDIGQKLTEAWGQQIVIDNRPSAAGVIAGEITARAAPDGYTLMMISTGHAVNATLYRKLPYDTIKDFSAIALAAEAPNLLVATPSLAVKSARDLIALAKSRPGQINYASGGVGSGTHMVAEQFKYEAGINVTHVPYKGTPEALTSTISGATQYFFAPVTVAIPLVKSGKLTGVGMTSRARSPAAPGIPTVMESGLPGFEFYFWLGLVGPANMPAALKQKISGEVLRILASPQISERLLSQGATPHPMPPDKFDAFIKAEVGRLGKVIRASGMRAD
jgi:tripartite-type tricarboxylate transporter receptor subunit TctC